MTSLHHTLIQMLSLSGVTERLLVLFAMRPGHHPVFYSACETDTRTQTIGNHAKLLTRVSLALARDVDVT